MWVIHDGLDDISLRTSLRSCACSARVRMRTTNGVDRLNKEIKRRTRVAVFPNSASCMRLVSAILTEQDEEWMTAKIYLTT